MKVLFDIVHPADVLFFYHPLRKLQALGWDVLVLAREKDVACTLLDSFGIPFKSVSVAGAGKIGLARELLTRDIRVGIEALRFRPDVMIGFGGVAISHVGAVTRIPSLSFYDTDTAKLQTRLTWPFISHLFVPEAYQGETPAGRTSRFPGIKEMSYFHPDNFRADKANAINAGLDPSARNFLVRTVSWRANHDIGKTGWSDDQLRMLVNRLSQIGKVHISTERALPSDLSASLYQGPANAIHDLMAHCDLYVGESATMALEAAVLGTPAIYDGADHPGTVRELQSAGLLTALHQQGSAQLMAKVEHMLEAQSRSAFDEAREAYLHRCSNLADYIVDAVVRFARR